jgi:hypothetical protein
MQTARKIQANIDVKENLWIGGLINRRWVGIDIFADSGLSYFIKDNNGEDLQFLIFHLIVIEYNIISYIKYKYTVYFHLFFCIINVIINNFLIIQLNSYLWEKNKKRNSLINY